MPLVHRDHKVNQKSQMQGGSMKIALESIDLSKGEEHEHPDINTKDTYLCMIDAELCAGKFDRQWYGLNFRGWLSSVGLQYDKPGSNASRWKAVWRISQKKARKKICPHCRGFGTYRVCLSDFYCECPVGRRLKRKERRLEEYEV
jgi:hypothetical protein